MTAHLGRDSHGVCIVVRRIDSVIAESVRVVDIVERPAAAIRAGVCLWTVALGQEADEGSGPCPVAFNPTAATSSGSTANQYRPGQSRSYLLSPDAK